MVAVLNQPERITQCVTLHNVSWKTYERLLEEQGERPSPRFTYNGGDLEIMVLSYEHEEINRFIADLFTTIALEFNIEFRHAGSTTFKRKDLAKGFEPDSSFYTKNEPRVRSKKRIDLSVDPPPDLAIEIDIAHSSLDKMDIYAKLRVPEVWRYDGKTISFHRLVKGKYREQKTSSVLPDVTSAILTQFVNGSKKQPHSTVLRRVREWARKQTKSGT